LLIAETPTAGQLTRERKIQLMRDDSDAAAANEDVREDYDVGDDRLNDEPALTSGPRPHRKTVNVGSAAVLDCDIDYPTVGSSQHYVQHIVTWRKQGVEAPVFIAFDGYPPRLDASYAGRVRAVGPASIEIDDVRTSDEGWYECTVLFIDQDDESPGNGTWTYLAVNSTSAHLSCVQFSSGRIFLTRILTPYAQSQERDQVGATENARHENASINQSDLRNNRLYLLNRRSCTYFTLQNRL